MIFAFAGPLALVLGALVLGPILAHLARRRPTRRHPFGAMLLLQRLARRMRRRRRLSDPWLLLLRVLVVAAAVLAAARPELRWPGAPPEVGGTGKVVVVIDDSLSMDLRESGSRGRSASLFAQARANAVEMLKKLPAGTEVAAIAIGGGARKLTPELTTDRASVIAAISNLHVTQGTTDLAGGLGMARRMLAGTGGEVVVFSDEAGPTAVTQAREEIEFLSKQGVALVPRPVHASEPANLAVIDARYGGGVEGGSVRFRVANYGAREVEAPVTVRLPDGTEINAFVDVPGDGTAEGSVTVPRVAEGGVGTVTVKDPALPLDDTFAFQLPRVGASRVLVVDGDPGPTAIASEVYFLVRALAPWGYGGRGGVASEVVGASGLVGALDPKDQAVVFLANVADPAPMANQLVDFVRNGGGLVISAGDNITADRYNAALGMLLPSRLRKPRSLAAPGEEGVPTGLPDTSLELFAPFARGGRSGFSHVHWTRLFTLEPYEEGSLGGAVHTLLWLENGNPLLVERKVGRGRVLLFTGTLDMDWGDFPLQSVFMPWVQRVVTYLGGDTGGPSERRSVLVGETVRVPVPDVAVDVRVTGPDGPVAAHVRDGKVSFTPEAAGAYVVETPGAPPLAWVAVNTDPVESDVRPGPSLVETAAQVDPDRFLRHFELGPWLWLAALGLVLLQGALAGPRRVEAASMAEAPDVEAVREAVRAR